MQQYSTRCRGTCTCFCLCQQFNILICFHVQQVAVQYYVSLNLSVRFTPNADQLQQLNLVIATHFRITV